VRHALLLVERPHRLAEQVVFLGEDPSAHQVSFRQGGEELDPPPTEVVDGRLRFEASEPNRNPLDKYTVPWRLKVGATSA
jgi:hypothetical protein